MTTLLKNPEPNSVDFLPILQSFSSLLKETIDFHCFCSKQAFQVEAGDFEAWGSKRNYFHKKHEDLQEKRSSKNKRDGSADHKPEIIWFLP